MGSHNAKSPADHHKKKLVQVMDEEEVQDPRGHHHQQPPSPQIFIGQEQMQRSNSGTMRPPAIRAQSRYRRKVKRHADAKRRAVLAQRQPVKKHKKLTADEYKRQLHNRVVNNPVFKHARLYGLLKTKKTKKHKNADAGAFDSEHKGVLSLAGLNTARKNGYKHVSLDFGLDNN